MSSIRDSFQKVLTTAKNNAQLSKEVNFKELTEKIAKNLRAERTRGHRTIDTPIVSRFNADMLPQLFSNYVKRVK